MFEKVYVLRIEYIPAATRRYRRKIPRDAPGVRSQPDLYTPIKAKASLANSLSIRSTRRLTLGGRAVRRIVAVSLAQVVDVLAPRLATRGCGSGVAGSASRSTSHHSWRWRRSTARSRGSFALYVVLGNLLGFFTGRSSLSLW
jgi:hypothetical protein